MATAVTKPTGGKPAGKVRSSWPLGPSTLTWPGANVTFTEDGTGTGNFPIRDNSLFFSYQT